MLKIFLTADNHVGLKYSQHENAGELRQRRIAAFEDMVAKANEEFCDLFVIAGDLFENISSISRQDIQSVLTALSAFHGTVAVLPGNHDYYDDGVKLWKDFRDAMRSRDNILLLSEYRAYTVPVKEGNAVLYPAFCMTKHSGPGENNLGWIRDSVSGQADGYRIGIAHGAVEGETIDNEGAYFLMKREELESIPVDVWLLGHTHVPFPKNLQEKEYSTGERIFNAGTHVQTDVACRTDGECFILELDEDHTVRAKKYISGNLRFYRKTLAFTADSMKNTLYDALSGIDADSVVELVLTGSVSAEEYANRHGLLEEALSRFVEGGYDDFNLNRQITKEQIDAEFPETSFAAKLLTALMEQPKEAQLAYELLNSLNGGKQK